MLIVVWTANGKIGNAYPFNQKNNDKAQNLKKNSVLLGSTIIRHAIIQPTALFTQPNVDRYYIIELLDSF